MKHNFYLLLIILVCFSCREDYIPKPKAFLRLEYPEAQYKKISIDATPFSFETNNLTGIIKPKRIDKEAGSSSFNIEYPTLKGTIFLTYKAIFGDKKKLNSYLRDAENFTKKHMIKADEIPIFPFEDTERKVYGVLSEVKGNVASTTQFYVTDSVNHFLTGSLYFYVKPNYDSILPATNYLQKDIKHIIETIEWK